jgi:hypothetical protein
MFPQKLERALCHQRACLTICSEVIARRRDALPPRAKETANEVLAQRCRYRSAIRRTRRCLARPSQSMQAEQVCAVERAPNILQPYAKRSHLQRLQLLRQCGQPDGRKHDAAANLVRQCTMIVSAVIEKEQVAHDLSSAS